MSADPGRECADLALPMAPSSRISDHAWVLLKSSARLVRRVLVTIVGLAVLGLGVALLALPGPGVLVIALGFLILSTEYEWARRRFESARQTAADLADQAVARPWSTVLSILASLGLIAAGAVWGSVSALPFSSWWTGGSLIFGGLAALTTIIVSIRQARRGDPHPHHKLSSEAGTEAATESGAESGAAVAPSPRQTG
jgi:uncharacterized protein (TIGR02611 family)